MASLLPLRNWTITVKEGIILSQTVLKMQNICKSFEKMEVLKGISFEVQKGEIVSIIGPSGSGKSTLLRCATMLEKADSGKITYDNIDMIISDVNAPAVYADKVTCKKINMKFGLVFQNFNLFPHFSVLQNIIEAPVRVAGVSKEEATKKSMELLKKVGLADRADAYPCQLSGGQQQRVAIARALAMNPDILFFDEPTSALDPELTGEILKVIKSLADEKMTMVIVTHEMNFARDISDRVIFMDEGVVVANGTPSEVLEVSDNPRINQFLNKISN